MARDFFVCACTARKVSVGTSSCRNAVICEWRLAHRERRESESESPFWSGGGWAPDECWLTAREGGSGAVSFMLRLRCAEAHSIMGRELNRWSAVLVLVMGRCRSSP